MLRNNNIILFSSGISEKSGLLDMVMQELESRNFHCYCWRDLFRNAKNQGQIALLPILIKKIPTFDFALLICEGHDHTTILRDGVRTELGVMRDNVLFEIGLCSVALGLDRVILLASESVRLPEDLQGIRGELAVKRVLLEQQTDAGIKSMIDQVQEHIRANQEVYSPVVIGASASTASGYVTNFVFRCVESVFSGFSDRDTGEWIVPEPGKLDMELMIPYRFSEKTSKAAREKQQSLHRGIIPAARRRNLEFNYERRGDRIVIRDYPTTLVTSYSTARTILKLQADDEADPLAEQRFVAKELDLFESALRTMLNPDYLKRYITHYYFSQTDEEKDRMMDSMCSFLEYHTHVIREDY